MSSDTTANWVARLRAGGVPCSRYHLPFEALDDEGAVGNGFVQDFDHPVVGRYRTCSTPVSMVRNHVALRGPSPSLGDHTDEVLGEHGPDAGGRAEH